MTAPPDLQEWINRHGGYHAIPWKEWHDANAEWRRQQLELLELDIYRPPPSEPQPVRKRAASRRRDRDPSSIPI